MNFHTMLPYTATVIVFFSLLALFCITGLCIRTYPKFLNYIRPIDSRLVRVKSKVDGLGSKRTVYGGEEGDKWLLVLTPASCFKLDGPKDSKWNVHFNIFRWSTFILRFFRTVHFQSNRSLSSWTVHLVLNDQFHLNDVQFNSRSSTFTHLDRPLWTWLVSSISWPTIKPRLTPTNKGLGCRSGVWQSEYRPELRRGL